MGITRIAKSDPSNPPHVAEITDNAAVRAGGNPSLAARVNDGTNTFFRVYLVSVEKGTQFSYRITQMLAQLPQTNNSILRVRYV